METDVVTAAAAAAGPATATAPTPSTTVVTVLGLLGDVRWVSGSVEDVLGVRVDDYLGSNVIDRVHRDDLPALDAFAGLPAEQLPVEVVHRMRHADGRWIPLRSTLDRVVAGDEAVVLAISVPSADDAGEAGDEVGRRYRQLIETSTDFLAVSIGGTIVAASTPTIELVAGGDPSLLIGRSVFDFVVPDSAPVAQRRLDTIANGDWPSPDRVRLQAVTGEVVDLEVASIPTIWQGTVATQLALRPLTDGLTEVVRIGAGLAGPVSQAIIITDLDYVIVSWNDAAARLYGLSECEALGRSFAEAVGWDDSDEVLGAAALELFSQGSWTGTVNQRRPDGEPIHVFATVRVVHDQQGQPIGIVSVNRLADEPHPMSPEAEILADFERGLEAGEIEVHYQPIVRTADGALVKVEALVRWQHPERGLLPPVQFVPAVERSSLISRLGEVVLSDACAQVMRWRGAGAPALELAVNLSARELTDPDLPARVTRMLEGTGLPADALWLEVTETALADDEEAAVAGLRALRSLGVHIALDDFGTGFAHLAHLRRFPVEALKIDRSFVAGMLENSSDAAIVRSVIALGRELRLGVVAEGVETTAQLEDLAVLRCELAQGYLIGRPMPAGDLPPGVAPVVDDAATGGVPASELERLAALHECAILDTEPEPEYDAVVELAALLCGTPMAVISLLDEDRVWFKARRGVETTATARAWAFCNYAIRSSETFVVRDASADWRFADHHLVADGFVRSYLGVPLVLRDGHRVGTLAVLDSTVHEFSVGQVRGLETLAAQVVALLEVRRVDGRLAQQAADLEALSAKLRDRETLLGVVFATTPSASFVVSMDGTIDFVSGGVRGVLGREPGDLIGRSALELVHESDLPVAIERLANVSADVGRRSPIELRLVRGDGSALQAEISATSYQDHEGRRRFVASVRPAPQP